jgi:hypothetical protein
MHVEEERSAWPCIRPVIPGDRLIIRALQFIAAEHCGHEDASLLIGKVNTQALVNAGSEGDEGEAASLRFLAAGEAQGIKSLRLREDVGQPVA